VSTPTVPVWVVAAGGVTALSWCAKGILTSDLPRGALVAAWLLWLIAATALLTLGGYLRELARHHHAVRAGGSWRPVPSLLLLWVGGLTALASLPLVLPGQPAAATAEGGGSPRVSGPTASPTVSPTAFPTASPTAFPGGGASPSATRGSRSADRSARVTAPAAVPGQAAVVATALSASSDGRAGNAPEALATTSSSSRPTSATAGPTRTSGLPTLPTISLSVP
jgi:hypothetical protein